MSTKISNIYTTQFNLKITCVLERFAIVDNSMYAALNGIWFDLHVWFQ